MCKNFMPSILLTNLWSIKRVPFEISSLSKPLRKVAIQQLAAKETFPLIIEDEAIVFHLTVRAIRYCAMQMIPSPLMKALSSIHL